jgi:hypothetical protein
MLATTASVVTSPSASATCLRFLGRSHDIDGRAAPPDAIDRRGQRGRHPSHRDQQLRRSRRDQQPRLIFDQGHATKGQGRRQHARLVFGFFGRENQAGQHRARLSGHDPQRQPRPRRPV